MELVLEEFTLEELASRVPLGYWTPCTMEKLEDDSPMPFGQHRGWKMERVPASYLLWLADAMGREDLTPAKEAVRAYVDRNRDCLEQEVAHGHDVDDQ